MPEPPGSSLSQNDWPKTTWKLTQLAQTQDRKAQGRAFLLGSLILMFSTQASLPNRVSCCVSPCVSSDNSFLSIRQEPLFRTWNRFPLPAIVSSCYKMREKKESLPQVRQDGLLLSLGLMWLPGKRIDYEEEFSDQFFWEGTTLSTSLTMPCWGKSQCPGALI